MIVEKLAERNLPELLKFKDGTPVKTPEDWRKRREEILEILRHEIYGYSPAAPAEVTGVVEEVKETAFGGKAVQERVWIEFDTPKGKFSFPITLIVPKKGRPSPAFLYISFRPEVPNLSLPAEEIVDNGYAIASVCYNDIAYDNRGYKPGDVCFEGPANGLASMFPRDPETGWGKIGVWAWAASRIMDYLCTRPEIDKERVCVIGHSRLGKTALWAAAQDERFSMAVSNDSGCGGAALFRQKVGERVADMKIHFPYWFCGNYVNYADREEAMPWDQHFLLALLAPRGLVVTSATEDQWADPVSEFLGAKAAEPAFVLTGQAGMEDIDRFPAGGEAFVQGNPAYHLREGVHYLGREDWKCVMDFRKFHGGKF